MVSARPLVNKGLIKRVGSGNSISVWEDPWIPASCPRPATGHGAISTLIFGEDVPIILGIPTSRTGKPDSMGWFFTKSGRYTVKSGYVLAQQILDEANPIKYGPDIRARLQSRGLQIDPQCVRCGMAPETVNHMLFECPPALQVWALSPIPTALDHFPTGGLFTNIAHLFWNLPNDERMGMYPWLLWFIWKARNDKVFSNDDSDPNDIINHAASEAVAWRTAQERQEVTLVWRGIRLSYLPEVKSVRLMDHGKPQIPERV
ncbi:unnamed protein product [Microthlaspi erraticum]|uniref:Reverse transcriptase zinc-binding domain-containing protein n=1 Tax=Microthlaspi erraticum TaxID=1685480 RepID=A0A6D2J593_9BRAS|nr:unnamed protein product [Microthlaspi erraticum]